MERQVFEIITLDYESDRRKIVEIIARAEWGVHDKSGLEVGEPSRYMGWTFFTVTMDVTFIAKMADVYESFMHAMGWTFYEKFEDWLRTKLNEAGSKARVKTLESEEFSDL